MMHTTVKWESPDGTHYDLQLLITGPRDDIQIEDYDTDPVLCEHDREALELYLDSEDVHEHIDESLEG